MEGAVMTPAEKMQAFESAKKLGRMFPGVMESFQAWAAIGSLEQAAKEAQVRLEALMSERGQIAIDMAKQREQTQADMVAKRLEADTVISARHRDANKAIAAKQAQSAGIIDEAIVRRDGMLAAAADKVSEWTNRADELKAEHDEWQAKIDALKLEHDAATAALGDKQGEHERIAGLIAELKAKL